MKSIWFAPIVMIILLAGCLQSWKEFSSVEGRYTVLMPGAPTEKTKYVKTAIGELAMHGAVLDHRFGRAPSPVFLSRLEEEFYRTMKVALMFREQHCSSE